MVNEKSLLLIYYKNKGFNYVWKNSVYDDRHTISLKLDPNSFSLEHKTQSQHAKQNS